MPGTGARVPSSTMSTPAAPLVPVGTNPTGAVFSFLRVLAVGLAVALLPFLTADGASVDALPWARIGTALAAAAALTLINYFRTGEVRFGRVGPNVTRAAA